MRDCPLIPEDSALRWPPPELSKRQIIFIDGIRYAVETADVAYDRLYDKLQSVAGSSSEPTTRDIAACVLDAWAVVDAVHRCVDLVEALPGLEKGPWYRKLRARTEDCLALRDDVQHLTERVTGIAENGGQLWGYISWAAVDENGQYTGQWLMMSPGSTYPGDRWLYAGPFKLPFPVPLGRIRLNAFGRQVYIGRSLDALVRAAGYIEAQLQQGKIRAIGTPSGGRRGADAVMQCGVEIIVKVPPAGAPNPTAV